MTRKIGCFLLFTLLGILPSRAQRVVLGKGMSSFVGMQQATTAYKLRCYVYGTDDFSQEPFTLQGAMVEWIAMGDTTVNEKKSTDEYGHTLCWLESSKKMKDERVRVRVSYLSMEPVDTILTPKVNKASGKTEYLLDIDSLIMVGKPVTTEEVEIIGELKKMYQRGDTLVFNTDAYEMPSGSVLLDLVRRLPGLTYDNGQLAYQGKTIEEMRLNGDTFFRGQVSIALNNIPTAKLKQLELYETQTDTMSLREDKHLVMDMVTKEPTNLVLSGNAKVGKNLAAKPDFMADADGSLYIKGGPQTFFRGTHTRLPNEKTVMKKDIRDYVRFNYMGAYTKKVVPNISQDYIHDNSASESQAMSQLFLPGATQETRSSTSDEQRSQQYIGNISIAQKFSKFSLNSSLKYNIGNSSSENRNTSETVGLNRSETTGTSHSSTRSIGWSEGITHKGKDVGYDVGGTINYSGSDSESTSNHSINYLQQGTTTAFTQRTQRPSDRFSMSVSGRLEKGWGKKDDAPIVLLLPHLFSTQYVYRFEALSRDYNLFSGDFASAGGLAMNADRSYKYKEHTHEHKIFLNYNFKKGKFSAHGGLQISPVSKWGEVLRENGERNDTTVRALLLAPTVSVSQGDFFNQLFSFRYQGNPQMIDPSSLLEMTDYNDPLNIHMNNKNLKRPYTHQFSFSTAHWGAKLTANLSLVDNGMSVYTRFNRETGQRITMPMNIDGNMNGSAGITYGHNFGEVALNAGSNYSYSRSANYVQFSGSDDPQKGVSGQHSWNFSLSPSYSNKMLTVNLSGNYTISHRNNDYLNYGTDTRTASASTQLKLLPIENLEINTSLNVNNYSGYELSDANRTDWLWNASVAYKFLKKRASLALECRDILNSVSDLTAILTENQWSETRRIGERRCILLSFSYRFNKM